MIDASNGEAKMASLVEENLALQEEGVSKRPRRGPEVGVGFGREVGTWRVWAGRCSQVKRDDADEGHCCFLWSRCCIDKLKM